MDSKSRLGPAEELLTIGQVAALSAVPATTLRYYDGLGLVEPVRLANGHRRYPVDVLERLQLVRLCQALGCTLDEVAVLLAPGGGPTRRTVAARKLGELEATLSRLAAVRAVLEHFAGCDHTADQAQECRLVTQGAWASVSPALPAPDAPARAAGARGRARPR